MRPEDLNPKRSKRLDALRKPEVKLLTFFANAYPEKTNFIADTKAFGRKLKSLGPQRNMSAVVEEWKARRGDAADQAFGTRQIPLLLNFDSGPYVGFIPDLMTPDELAAFKHSVMLHGLKLAEIVARKIDGAWRYEFGAPN